MDESSRKLIHDVPEDNMAVMIVRATDTPVYVEKGAADIGIVGRDTVLEGGFDVYEPLDLGIGKCRLSVARPNNAGPERQPIKIATKYPHLAEAFFSARGRQTEMIKLYGSIELAPLTGLSDCIVDLVSSGRTLKENGLTETDIIMEISTVVIVNRSSLKIRSAEVKSFLDRLRPVCGALPS